MGGIRRIAISHNQGHGLWPWKHNKGLGLEPSWFYGGKAPSWLGCVSAGKCCGLACQQSPTCYCDRNQHHAEEVQWHAGLAVAGLRGIRTERAPAGRRRGGRKLRMCGRTCRRVLWLHAPAQSVQASLLSLAPPHMHSCSECTAAANRTAAWQVQCSTTTTSQLTMYQRVPCLTDLKLSWAWVCSWPNTETLPAQTRGAVKLQLACNAQ